MPAQSASELLEEFAAISDFIESGEQPSKGDRHNAISLWGKMVSKIASGPGAMAGKYKMDRAGVAASIAFEDKDGKPMPIARFDHEVAAILEQKEPGRVAMYHSAIDMIERLDRCILFLQQYLVETAPPPPAQTIGSMPAKAIEAVMDKPEKTEETAADVAPKKPRAKRIKVPEPEAAAPSEDAAAGKDEDEHAGDSGADQDASEDSPAPAEAVEETPKSSFQKILDKAGK